MCVWLPVQSHEKGMHLLTLQSTDSAVCVYVCVCVCVCVCGCLCKGTRKRCSCSQYKVGVFQELHALGNAMPLPFTAVFVCALQDISKCVQMPSSEYHVSVSLFNAYVRL